LNSANEQGTAPVGAGTGGITGEMIRDLMVESIERRFGDRALPHPIQWLSDNGGCYRAHETIDFAIGVGFVPCFTPVRSPQSNGMAEAFVKTFSEITCMFTIALMLKQFCLSCPHGSRTTTRAIHTKVCR
jgi:transposase InsO family protein